MKPGGGTQSAGEASPVINEFMRAPALVTKDQVVAALQHVTSRVDTERILERLGFTEQEIADAIR